MKADTITDSQKQFLHAYRKDTFLIPLLGLRRLVNGIKKLVSTVVDAIGRFVKKALSALFTLIKKLIGGGKPGPEGDGTCKIGNKNRGPAGHVYRVGESGVLVHNTSDPCCEGNGPYSDLAGKDNTVIEAGKKFTPTQKPKIIAANKARNGGVIKSDDPDDPFQTLQQPTVTIGGISRPDDEAHVDHIIPKIGPDGQKLGSNSYCNARVISFRHNLNKSNTLGK